VHDVADAAEALRGKAEGNGLVGERVAFLVENGYDYVGRLSILAIEHAHILSRHSDSVIDICQSFCCCPAVYDISQS
jgi:hypothetical protein